jgi:hypothetical protein
VACPRCGVVFAKLRERMPGPPPPPIIVPRAREGLPWNGILGVAAALAVLLFGMSRLRPRTGPAPAAEATPASAPAETPAAVAEAPPPDLPDATPLLPPLSSELAVAQGVTDAERTRVEDLHRRLSGGSGMSPEDAAAAESLLAAHPDEPALKQLAAAVLNGAAFREREKRRFAEAAGLLQRATALLPGNAQLWLNLMQVHIEAGDWAGAEAAARAALAVEPRHADALKGLGYALFRQDRSREAGETLATAQEVAPDARTQAMLDRIRRGMLTERGMAQQSLSHFNVRYDGGEHADVGREILRALERHYATLTSSLDHQPSTAIPVILFTSQGYYDASGAPAWSGGSYDNIDGRIRLPIGGLTASLTPDLDETLIHELTHAFVADATRGTAPREVHEGLAQYMEGKRSANLLNAEQMRALADGRIVGVSGFYLGALSFVEHLIATRGMGGVNDLLDAMGATGNVDEAFRQVHGQPYSAVQQAWRARLAQQHGS